jgi:hypothetical protein
VRERSRLEERGRRLSNAGQSDEASVAAGSGGLSRRATTRCRAGARRPCRLSWRAAHSSAPPTRSCRCTSVASPCLSSTKSGALLLWRRIKNNIVWCVSAVTCNCSFRNWADLLTTYCVLLHNFGRSSNVLTGMIFHLYLLLSYKRNGECFVSVLNKVKGYVCLTLPGCCALSPRGSIIFKKKYFQVDYLSLSMSR